MDSSSEARPVECVIPVSPKALIPEATSDKGKLESFGVHFSESFLETKRLQQGSCPSRDVMNIYAARWRFSEVVAAITIH